MHQRNQPFTNGYFVLTKDKMMLKMTRTEADQPCQFVRKKIHVFHALLGEDQQFAAEATANTTDVSTSAAHTILMESWQTFY